MNINEYKNNKSSDFGKLIDDEPSIQYTRDFSFRHGFEVALNLDLPIKFAEFTHSVMPKEAKDIIRENPKNWLEPLYEWWIKNIDLL